jgi:glycerol kinase
VLTSVVKCLDDFENKGFDKNNIVSIGISNQRETFVLWDQKGNPLHNAVVWQCKRSLKICEELKEKNLSGTISQKTGLVIDPYFSATKLIWLLRHNETIKEAVENGNAYFGTIDTWLLYKLTNGSQYATDHTNASRTMLFNLHSLQWDEALIDAFELRGINLPSINSSSGAFGETSLSGHLNAPVPVAALIGDSHAAAFGEACFDKGMAKATMGTGCSILMNIGNKPVQSRNGMVTTICWSIPGRIDYALEGVIVSCGATIEWLKNELNLFSDSAATAAMANAVADNGGVVLIPAFSGLGSPHWDMERKASLTGLSFGTTKNHLVRAALESIPYQIKDVIVAMEMDAGLSLSALMVDGGITSNTFVLQFLTDLLRKNVTTINTQEVSALGAAYLAGLHTGVFINIESLQHLNKNKNIHQPVADASIVHKGYENWLAALKK